MFNESNENYSNSLHRHLIDAARHFQGLEFQNRRLDDIISLSHQTTARHFSAFHFKVFIRQFEDNRKEYQKNDNENQRQFEVYLCLCYSYGKI